MQIHVSTAKKKKKKRRRVIVCTRIQAGELLSDAKKTQIFRSRIVWRVWSQRILITKKHVRTTKRAHKERQARTHSPRSSSLGSLGVAEEKQLLN